MIKDAGGYMLCSPTYKYDDWQRFRNNSEYREYIMTKLSLANRIFCMSYTTFDTVERGAHILEVALKHYLDVLRVYPTDAVGSEDRAAVLLVALDYDEAAEDFMRFYLSLKRDGDLYFSLNDDDDVSARELLQSLGVDEKGWVYRHIMTLNREWPVKRSPSLPFLFARLLIQMKALVATREAERRFDEFKRTRLGRDLGQVHSVILGFISGGEAAHAGDIGSTIVRINGKSPGALLHLRETVPFSRDHVHIFDIMTPAEYWPFLQDCFILTPGVNSILCDYTDDIELLDDDDDDDMYGLDSIYGLFRR